jgi:ABC-2 type transport system ATP-binding protein
MNDPNVKSTSNRIPDHIIISARAAVKRFDDEIAVRDVTFDVPEGAIFGFIGPSGSGKTTTVRLLTGVLTPTSGELTVFGRRPGQFDTRTRRRLGYMPQLFVLYPELSVWENLNFVASLYGMGLGRARRLRELLDFVELGPHRHKLARDISGGMQRRLSLAATLVHNPELVFLDEPTAGIDPVLRRKLWHHFRELQGEGHSLFVTTQYVGETANCDLVGVMVGGRLLCVDTPDGLRHRAYGGDMVDLKATVRLQYQERQELRELPFVRRTYNLEGENALRLVVDEARTAIPALVEWSRIRAVSVESVEEFAPPYDDVFVELVRQGEANA